MMSFSLSLLAASLRSAVSAVAGGHGLIVFFTVAAFLYVLKEASRKLKEKFGIGLLPLLIALLLLAAAVRGQEPPPDAAGRRMSPPGPPAKPAGKPMEPKAATATPHRPGTAAPLTGPTATPATPSRPAQAKGTVPAEAGTAKGEPAAPRKRRRRRYAQVPDIGQGMTPGVFDPSGGDISPYWQKKLIFGKFDWQRRAVGEAPVGPGLPRGWTSSFLLGAPLGGLGGPVASPELMGQGKVPDLSGENGGNFEGGRIPPRQMPNQGRVKRKRRR